MIEFKFRHIKSDTNTTVSGSYYVGHFADVTEQDADGNDITVNRFIRVARLKDFKHTFTGALSRVDVDSRMRAKLLEIGNGNGRIPIPQQAIE